MSVAHFFPKPQPLSPNTRTWVENGTRYRKYSTARNGRKKVIGLPTDKSIYFYWYEYLKLSKKYKKLCGYDVSVDKVEYADWKKKYGNKLYKDFGNIFEYEGLNGFWRWWNTKVDDDGTRRGEYLFGIQVPTSIQSSKSNLVSIDLSLPPSEIQKQIKALQAKTKVSQSKKPKALEKARYELAQTKVDALSLRKAMVTYVGLKIQNKDVYEVGTAIKYYETVVKEYDKAAVEKLQEDRRKKVIKKYDYLLLDAEISTNEGLERYFKIHDEVIKIQTMRQAKADKLMDTIEKEEADEEAVRNYAKVRERNSKYLKLTNRYLLALADETTNQSKIDRIEKLLSELEDIEANDETVYRKPTREESYDGYGYLGNDKGWHRFTSTHKNVIGFDFFDSYLIETLISVRANSRKTFEKLVKEKDYLRTNTLRLCKKAIKNIEAVERGEFGYGF